MRSFLVTLMALACGAWSQSGWTAGDVTAPPNSVRLYWAKSSDTDLTTAFFGDYDASRESAYLIAASFGHRFSDTMFGLPIPMSLNFGLQYLNERGYQDDGWGTTAFVKASYSWQLPSSSKHITFGLGEGLSYASVIPMSEQRDFARKGGAQSENLLNYVEWTIDVPLRQFATFEPLFHRSALEDLSVGFIVWHRSSIYGLLAETKGGVNYMGFGLEGRF